MLNTAFVLGISMTPRRSRRWLVAVTYMIMLILSAAILLVPSWRIRRTFIPASMTFCLSCWLVFRTLVKQAGPLDMGGGKLIDLGLVPRWRGQEELDERDVATRNAACFRAYRVLALYAILLFAATWFYLDLQNAGALKVLQLVVMPGYGLALTLPQAALLWSEPDVPPEAGN